MTQDFSGLRRVKTGTRVQRDSCSVGPRRYPAERKTARAWRWPLTPYSAEVKNEWSYATTPSYTIMKCTGTNFAFILTCTLTADYIIRPITTLQTTDTGIRLCGWTHVIPKETLSLEPLNQAG